MKKLISILIITILALSYCGSVFADDIEATPAADIQPEIEYFANAEIVKQMGVITTPSGTADQYEMLFTSGEFSGQSVVVQHSLVGNTAMDIIVDVGDKIILRYTLNDDGEIETISVSDFQRNNTIIILAMVFIALMIIVGGIKGIKALVSLAITVGSILFILIPAILAGYDPAAVTILVAGVITFLTFVIINGFNKKPTLPFWEPL